MTWSCRSASISATPVTHVTAPGGVPGNHVCTYWRPEGARGHQKGIIVLSDLANKPRSGSPGEFNDTETDTRVLG
jgi:hypothetical protein